MHVRFIDDDEIQLGDRIQLDVAHFGAFAHDLLVHLALRRHVHHTVALHQGFDTTACDWLSGRAFHCSEFLHW